MFLKEAEACSDREDREGSNGSPRKIFEPSNYLILN